MPDRSAFGLTLAAWLVSSQALGGDVGPALDFSRWAGIDLVASGDFNGDGFGDVAGLDRSVRDEVLVWSGDASGIFGEPSVVDLGEYGSYFLGAEASDLDNDGFDDLVLTDRGFTSIVWGSIGGLPALAVPLRVPPDVGSTQVSGVGVGDVNDDGLTDILQSFYNCTTSSGGLRVFAGVDGRSFQQMTLNNTPSYQVLCGTYDNGLLGRMMVQTDLPGHCIMSAGSQLALRAYEIADPMTLEFADVEYVPYSEDPDTHWVLARFLDVTGDGGVEVLAQSLHKPTAPQPRTTLLKYEEGHWNPSTGWSKTDASSLTYATIADFNGDGREDVVLDDYTCSLFGVYFGNADGSMTLQQFLYEPEYCRLDVFFAADMTGDGLPDLAIRGDRSSDPLIVFVNRGDGWLVRAGLCVPDINTKNVNPGEPGYGAPDGTVDGADLSYFVENWLNLNPAVADMNTKNANPGEAAYGTPDGVVDGADLSYFVEAWLAGCP